MNNDPEREPLWDALLDDAIAPELRERLFRQTVATARRRRRRRFGMAVAGFLLPLGLLLFLSSPDESIPVDQAAIAPSPSPTIHSAESAPKLARRPEIISDEELFAMFPDHALALVGSPGEQQLVILGERN